MFPFFCKTKLTNKVFLIKQLRTFFQHSTLLLCTKQTFTAILKETHIEISLQSSHQISKVFKIKNPLFLIKLFITGLTIFNKIQTIQFRAQEGQQRYPSPARSRALAQAPRVVGVRPVVPGNPAPSPHPGSRWPIGGPAARLSSVVVVEEFPPSHGGTRLNDSLFLSLFFLSFYSRFGCLHTDFFYELFMRPREFQLGDLRFREFSCYCRG